MPRPWLRKVELYAGVPGQPGRTWRGLHISFKVTKSSKRSPNPIEVEIWNLGMDSRAWLEQDDMVISLRVGYGESMLTTLAIGDVADVEHVRDGSEYITTIEAGDGERAFQLADMDKSFRSGVTNREVLEAVVKASGLGVGHIAALPERQYTGGFCVSGHIRDALDALCGPVGASWSIQDGRIQVTLDDEGTNQQAVLLTPNTGLIGSPEKVKSRGKKTKRKLGIKAVSLLNPHIRPKSYVQIESEMIKGFYLVRSVTHSGETFGEEFQSELEATAAGPPAPTATMTPATTELTSSSWWTRLRETSDAS